MVDVCCLQKVRWRGEGACFIGVKGRRYKLWWYGNDDKTGGVGILVKEELCENVVEIRKRCDRVMAIGLALKEEMVRVCLCLCTTKWKTNVLMHHKVENQIQRKRDFKRKWRVSGVWQMQNEMVLGLGDFNGHVGKCAEGFEVIHGGYGIGKRNVEGRMLLDFCVQKDLCVVNTWYKRDERKVTYSSGGNDTEIDFVLVGKEKRKYLRDVKVIPGELQHRLMVVDVEERKLKKKEIKEEFEQRVVVVDTEAVDLWESYKNGVLKACDELCGKTKRRRAQGNTWWWNEQVEAIDWKKKAFNTWCKNRSPENKNNYRKARNQTKKVVAKAMKQATEEEIKVLCVMT